jgi:hypothetical protein
MQAGISGSRSEVLAPDDPQERRRSVLLLDELSCLTWRRRHVRARVRVTARAPDGVIEAIEVPGAAFCLGVQWELQDECTPGGNGDRILRLFLAEAARAQRSAISRAP